MSNALLDQILTDVNFEPPSHEVEIAGSDPVFPIPWRVADAGAAAIAAAGMAAADLWRLRSGRGQVVRVDVEAAAAAMRSSQYLRREPFDTPPGASFRGQSGNIFRARNGRWIYLHREFEHHRQRIAALLKCADDPDSVSRAAAEWDAAELEDAVFTSGACAGMVRSAREWDAHEQARTLARLPLLEVLKIGDSPPEPPPKGERPLSGIRVLDLTRVLAGPTCARTLAEHGADVLRVGTNRLPINETQIIDTGHGKRSTVIELDTESGVEQLRSLVRSADVFSQSYRPGSLAARGFSPEAVAAIKPGVVYVSLSAFGHAGPWAARRGFDTLVQTVSGFADAYADEGRPRLLPVSALDYITGYLAAFGAMVAVGRRAREGGSYHVRLSLAQTCHWLRGLGRFDPEQLATVPRDLAPDRLAALTTSSESPFGRLSHLAPTVQMSETPARWDRPAVPLDFDAPEWL